jgi:hypothetical protein
MDKISQLPWVEMYAEPGNKIQGGIAGYHIQNGKEGIAFNIARKENAEFIIRACNAHNYLVNACKVLLECAPMQQGERNGAIMGSISIAIDMARKALEKSGE